MLDFTGRVAIVTGGASGIGLATALLFAKHHAKVFVGDFDPLDSTTATLKESGVEVIKCDVRIESDVEHLVKTAAAAGRYDILFNNAGIQLVKDIPDVTSEEWDLSMDTNLKGPFLLCKHSLPIMVANGGGAIINNASNAGLLPRAADPVYSISKGALISFTKSLALSHSKDRIRVNAVCPGPVKDTRMMADNFQNAADAKLVEQKIIGASPLAKAHGRMIDPDEIAQSVLYLASDAASMITGTSIAIDGGKALGVPPGWSAPE